MNKIAIFPGSFDPFTVGHESVVRRSIGLFDQIIIAIGYNSNKPGFFPLDTRIEWIRQVFKNENSISVDHYADLTVDYCRRQGASYILRGLRTSADFEYERAIAQVNKLMHKGIESVFLLTMPEHTPVTSSIVRDIIRHGGDASQFLPEGLYIEPGKYKI